MTASWSSRERAKKAPRSGGLHPTGNRQRRLEDRERREAPPAQLVPDSVPIRIDVLAEALHRLHAVVMVHGVVAELPQRDHGALLVEGLHDQIPVHALDLGRIDVAPECRTFTDGYGALSGGREWRRGERQTGGNCQEQRSGIPRPIDSTPLPLDPMSAAAVRSLQYRATANGCKYLQCRNQPPDPIERRSGSRLNCVRPVAENTVEAECRTRRASWGETMSNDGDRERDYIEVPIHQGFYYNAELELPTVVQAYAQIEKILIDSKYLACITIRVENLNQIEYQYGSTIYHKLLRQVATIISDLKQQEFRDEDIFVIDLLDIDTFVLFLAAPREKKTTLLDHLESLAERARATIKSQIFDTLYPYFKVHSKPSVGYGLVVNNPMISNMRLIMQLVSQAKKMGEFMSERQGYITKYMLQKTLIQEDIHTVFQPIVDLATLEVIGYEALSRGKEGTEFASPMLMFILAAEYGLSFELDALCRRKTFESVRDLKTDKKIFVNTLTMTIHDPEFRGAYLKQLLEDLKIKPENVVFEVNEKLAIDNYDLFREAMQDYLDIGIVHASDDIGAGDSDLERIMELHPGFLKIDIGLVRNLDTSIVKQEIIKAMVALAKGIGSLIVAEGVERREEYWKLRGLGVTYGQGYLFGKPSLALDAECSTSFAELEIVEPAASKAGPVTPTRS